jgi:hypothetical protein
MPEMLVDQLVGMLAVNCQMYGVLPPVALLCHKFLSSKALTNHPSRRGMEQCVQLWSQLCESIDGSADAATFADELSSCSMVSGLFPFHACLNLNLILKLI